MTASAWPPISSPPGTGGGGGSNVANGSVEGQMLVWNSANGRWEPAAIPTELIPTPIPGDVGMRLNRNYAVYVSSGVNFSYLNLDGNNAYISSTNNTVIDGLLTYLTGDVLIQLVAPEIDIQGEDVILNGSTSISLVALSVSVSGDFRHTGDNFAVYGATPYPRPASISTPEQYTAYLRGIGMIDSNSEFPTFAQQFDEARTRSIIF